MLTAEKLINKGIEGLKKEIEHLQLENEKLKAQLGEAYLNKSAAGRFIGVSHTTINRMIKAGQLKETASGKISKIDLLNYIHQKNKTQ